MKTLVSIIVPVYNTKPDFIEKCIGSLICQSYSFIEIIIVDDGSKKEIADYCETLKGLDSRIRIFHKDNGGVSSARNLGLVEAKGDYISFVDADDWVHPEFINILVSLLEKNDSDLSICAFNYVYSGQKLEDSLVTVNDYKVLDRTGVFTALLHSTKVGGFLWNKIFKKNLIVHRLDENLYYSEDFVFSAEYCAMINVAVATEEKLYFYRQNAGNATSDFSYNDRIISLIQSYLRLEQIYAEYSNEEVAYVKRNTLKIALNLRARYKLNHCNDKEQLMFFENIIKERIWDVLKSRKINLLEKGNILITYSFPVVIFRVKNLILRRKI